MPQILKTPLTEAELTSLRTRRDRGSEHRYNWDSSGSEVLRAFDAGERNFAAVTLPPTTDFEGVKLDTALFTLAKLVRVNLSSASLRESNFEDAWLRRANLDSTDFYRSNLSRATLESVYAPGAWFQGATLEKTNLSDANLRGANFRNATLKHAFLDGANLREAQFQFADLRGTSMIYTDTIYTNFEGANLLNVPGVYSAYANSLSSRGDSLFGSLMMQAGEIHLRLWAGCKQNCSPEVMRLNVANTYGRGDSIGARGRQYEAAITYIEVAFAADMEAHRWDYLLTWDEDNRPQQTQTD